MSYQINVSYVKCLIYILNESCVHHTMLNNCNFKTNFNASTQDLTQVIHASFCMHLCDYQIKNIYIYA